MGPSRQEIMTCWVCGKEEAAKPSWSFLCMSYVYEGIHNIHFGVTLCTDCKLETLGFLEERKDSMQGDN